MLVLHPRSDHPPPNTPLPSPVHLCCPLSRHAFSFPMKPHSACMAINIYVPSSKFDLLRSCHTIECGCTCVQAKKTDCFGSFLFLIDFSVCLVSGFCLKFVFFVFFFFFFFVCPLFFFVCLGFVGIVSLVCGSIILAWILKEFIVFFPFRCGEFSFLLFVFPFSSFVLLILHTCHWLKRKVGNALPTHVENVTSTLAWHQCLSLFFYLFIWGKPKVGGFHCFPFRTVCSPFILYFALSFFFFYLISTFAFMLQLSVHCPPHRSISCLRFVFYNYYYYYSVECISCLCRIPFVFGEMVRVIWFGHFPYFIFLSFFLLHKGCFWSIWGLRSAVLFFFFFHPIYIHIYIYGIIRICLVKLVSEVRNPLPFDANNYHYNVPVLIYSIVIKETDGWVV